MTIVNKVYYLGIHDGHNASVALSCDGNLLACYQEERFVKEKNYDGFPGMALEKILIDFDVKASEITKVGVNGKYQPSPLSREQRLQAFKKRSDEKIKVKRFLKSRGFVKKSLVNLNKKLRLERVCKAGFKSDQIVFLDHHLLHASAAYFGSKMLDTESLVLTNDGSGDGYSAKVYVARDGGLEQISAISDRASIGHLYSIFTYLLGMVPLEHEYKIMGMEPYCDQARAEQFRDELNELFCFDSATSLTWAYRSGRDIFYDVPFLERLIRHKRFDVVMGGLQMFIEEFLQEWVRRCVEQTQIQNVCLSGGTFMNVKANQCIMNLPKVKNIFVFPSCGDESNAIGACFWLTASSPNPKIEVMKDVYLGPDIAYPEDIEEALRSSTNTKITYSCPDDVNSDVADLLVAGHVVGRFNGREEFGARSLGNRAILADPMAKNVVKHINELVKNRDFWMPFACSIKAARFDDYVIGNDKNDPEYMIMTYDTVNKKRPEMLGGIHPYDSTVRPQLLLPEVNPEYHSLFEAFEKLTGRGVIMNTSLNLHGLPLAHDFQDCVQIMVNSGLRYLQFGKFLLEKVCDDSSET